MVICPTDGGWQPKTLEMAAKREHFLEGRKMMLADNHLEHIKIEKKRSKCSREKSEGRMIAVRLAEDNFLNGMIVFHRIITQ